jgi:2-C-methyl-D-erythritol 2,4-cyclodiphosphate synthase
MTIDGAPRLSGHSDGDVVLHAVADAILGAAGLGDLGRLFPAGPSTPAGIDSSRLLLDVVGRAAADGLAVVGLDVTIVGARPRLADVLPAMGDRLAELVGADPTAVNVKASTGNLAGFEGAGRGISAIAIATLLPVSPAGRR